MDGSDGATYNEMLVDSKDFSFSNYEECEYSVFYLCSNLNENDVADGEEKHKSSSICTLNFDHLSSIIIEVQQC